MLKIINIVIQLKQNENSFNGKENDTIQQLLYIPPFRALFYNLLNAPLTHSIADEQQQYPHHL